MALSDYIEITFFQERKSIGAEVNWGVRFLVPEDVRVLRSPVHCSSFCSFNFVDSFPDLDVKTYVHLIFTRRM